MRGTAWQRHGRRPARACVHTLQPVPDTALPDGPVFTAARTGTVPASCSGPIPEVAEGGPYPSWELPAAPHGPGRRQDLVQVPPWRQCRLRCSQGARRAVAAAPRTGPAQDRPRTGQHPAQASQQQRQHRAGPQGALLQTRPRKRKSVCRTLRDRISPCSAQGPVHPQQHTSSAPWRQTGRQSRQSTQRQSGPVTPSSRRSAP